MKKSKLFGLFALTAILGLSLASCNENNNQPVDNDPIDAVDTSKYPVIDMEVAVKQKQLSSISIDTTNVKTSYYIGEKFSTEGLVVKSNWISYVDGTPQNAGSEEVKDYTVDTSDVNMSVMGSYPVLINYRVGAKLVQATYNITVGSSYLDSLGIEYLAGITPDQTIFDFDLGGDFTPPAPTFTLHYMKNGVETEKTHVATGVEALSIVPDDSAVDTTKKGIYMVKYSYRVSKYTDEETGKKVEAYNVVSYVIVNMRNPITNLEFVSGETTFAQTTSNLNFDDWKLKFTRKNGDVEEVNYSPELFTVADINKWDVKANTVTLTSVENPEISLDVEINITESTTQNFTFVKNLGHPTSTSGAAEYIAANSNDKVKLINAINGSSKVHAAGRGTKDIYADLGFDTRISVGSSTSAVQIYITTAAAGNIEVFYGCASAGRLLQLVDSEGNILGEVETNGANKSGQALIFTYTFNVPAAGTYTLKTKSSQIYVHGIVIAENK